MHSATADLAKSYSSSSSSAFNPTEGIPNPQPHPTPQSHVKPLSSSSSVAIAAAARSVVGSSVQSASVSGTATPTAAAGTGTGGTGTPNIALLSSLCRSEMSLNYSYFLSPSSVLTFLTLLLNPTCLLLTYLAIIFYHRKLRHLIRFILVYHLSSSE